MRFTGWGRYPVIEARAHYFETDEHLKHILSANQNMIPFGYGRSYGDSALGRNIIPLRHHDCLLDFDETSGLLKVESGILLSEIIDVFLPRGWFLKVTPGTKLITIGGAIASDVHGKNHHQSGCFSESVRSLRLMLPDGSIARCSHTENRELFRATCGGMGLTGVILDAVIELQRIESCFINQRIIKTQTLEETFEIFKIHENEPYSVAWIDCLAKGRDIGKGLVMVGDFSSHGGLKGLAGQKIMIPMDFPSSVLNKTSIRLFNTLYYHRIRGKCITQVSTIDSFFYPLDSIGNWNRIYGRNGFTQYQIVLPKSESLTGIKKILKLTADAGKGSFLAVLKLFGEANNNHLSFPMKGYTLALDFKIERGLFELLDRLDSLVLDNGGRIYLTKDVRTSKSVMEKGYPRINEFRQLREQYGMDQKFHSLQSKRLGL